MSMMTLVDRFIGKAAARENLDTAAPNTIGSLAKQSLMAMPGVTGHIKAFLGEALHSLRACATSNIKVSPESDAALAEMSNSESHALKQLLHTGSRMHEAVQSNDTTEIKNIVRDAGSLKIPLREIGSFVRSALNLIKNHSEDSAAEGRALNLLNDITNRASAVREEAVANADRAVLVDSPVLSAKSKEISEIMLNKLHADRSRYGGEWKALVEFELGGTGAPPELVIRFMKHGVSREEAIASAKRYYHARALELRDREKGLKLSLGIE